MPFFNQKMVVVRFEGTFRVAVKTKVSPILTILDGTTSRNVLLDWALLGNGTSPKIKNRVKIERRSIARDFCIGIKEGGQIRIITIKATGLHKQPERALKNLFFA